MREYKIKLVSKRGELIISKDSVCKLLSGGLVGFDCAGFDVKIGSYAVGTGGAVTKRRFAERELKIKFEIDAVGDEAEKIRRSIISMLDPREDLKLIIEFCGSVREIVVIPYGEADFFRATLCDRIVVTLNFVSPLVFFSDTESRIVNFRTVASLLTFPLTFIKGVGMEVGIYRVSDTAEITNEGDAECGIVARLRAVGGDVHSPGIRCGDKFIRTTLTLSDGDELLIDTRPKMKNITKNGERTFMFDRDSSFFSLPISSSTMSITADEGVEFIEAEVEFVPVYFGV